MEVDWANPYRRVLFLSRDEDMKTVTTLLVAVILSACGPSRATRYRQAAEFMDDARTIYKHTGESLESEVARSSELAPAVGSDAAYRDDLKLFVSSVCK